MENASKALLIAAAVLIAIVIIGLGISLLRSVNSTSIQAKKTEELLDSGTRDKTDDLSDKLDKIGETENTEKIEGCLFIVKYGNEEIYRIDRKLGTKDTFQFKTGTILIEVEEGDFNNKDNKYDKLSRLSLHTSSDYISVTLISKNGEDLSIRPPMALLSTDGKQIKKDTIFNNGKGEIYYIDVTERYNTEYGFGED